MSGHVPAPSLHALPQIASDSKQFLGNGGFSVHQHWPTLERMGMLCTQPAFVLSMQTVRLAANRTLQSDS